VTLGEGRVPGIIWMQISRKPEKIEARSKEPPMAYGESNGHVTEIQDGGLAEICTV